MLYASKACFTLLALCFIFSCTLQKKRYSSGYHVEHSAISKNASNVNDRLQATIGGDADFILRNGIACSPDKCDTIVLKNGNKVASNITEVSDHEVKYKLCDKTDGPVVVVLSKEVSLIKFKDGTIKTFVELGDFAGPITLSGMVGDSCVTIIKKDGTKIRARLTRLDKSNVDYTLCNDSKISKKAGTSFISKILTDGGRDIKPQIPNLVSGTVLHDEGDPEYVEPRKINFKQLIVWTIVLCAGAIVIVLFLNNDN